MSTILTPAIKPESSWSYFSENMKKDWKRHVAGVRGKIRNGHWANQHICRRCHYFDSLVSHNLVIFLFPFSNIWIFWGDENLIIIRSICPVGRADFSGQLDKRSTAENENSKPFLNVQINKL